ncbi:glycosyltransferase involved in cell wall biosynthesis [Kineococcus rhizosphaerae]|uniref:Glycosyltransferase involved in cell wall biosynthesis n=1 Tax=Kineococcus rhizosphaerae TaxID=559628 RepID=A0A2T0RBA8_9ACTN|nr:glycosyltransferase involved in cell wall biosynthesis [Kineococcus rhizosphaerae]
MSELPRVSVVMAAWNAATTVAAAVSSVLWQTYPAWELVVVDDGSTDSTADLVSAFDDPRITLVKQENAGAGSARNAGMEAARGDLITFLDSDDVMLGRHLEALVERLGDRTRAIVTANSYWLLPGGIDPSHTRHKGRFPAVPHQRLSLLEQNYLSPMSLFRRELLEDVGGFDTTLHRSEDWDFWLRAVFAGHEVVHQPRPLALFRWGQSSMSTNRDLVFDAERTILEGMSSRDDLRDDERAYLRRRLASPPPRLLSNEGDAALRGRQYARAAQRFAAAADLSPSETMLVRKAQLMKLAPRLAGPLLRARQVRRENALAFDAEFEH